MTTLNYTTPKTHDDLYCLFRDTLSGDEHKRARVGFALDHANEVKYLMTDRRLLSALEVCQLYVDGKATDEELWKTADDAYDAYNAAPAYTLAYTAYYATTAAESPTTAYDAAQFTVAIETDPLPQKTLDRLEKWFPRSEPR